ncbi:MAG: LytTR family transcriptional regulator [Phenylobacterium sp.]|nr:LytTR family transcriptional regulator [Phenylobacterium sp.]
MSLGEIHPRQATLSWPYFLLFAGLGLVTLFTLLDPEPSRSLGLIERFLFWLLHAGGLLFLRRLNPWIQITLAGLIGTALFAPIGTGLDEVFGLAAVSDDLNLTWPHQVLNAFADTAPAAVFIWVGLNAARNLRLPTLRETGHRPQPALQELSRVAQPAPLRLEDQSPAPALASEAATPPFWSRVPSSLGDDLVALTAELHYLRVETVNGNALILYPFGQAVAELAASSSNGSQIHRSHWVAHSHVANIQKDRGRVFCVLTSGTRLPIGRRRQATIVARLSSV